MDHLRAALIALHLCVITVAAVPTPAGYLKERWMRDAHVVESVDRWARVPRALGMDVETPVLVDRLFAAGRLVVAVHDGLVGPFEPYFRYCGTAQSWRMFGGVGVDTGRLEVHGRRPGGGWEPLYVERGPGRWRASFFEQERIRAFRSHFALRQSRSGYDRFADWVAARAREDHPELELVRVRYTALVLADPQVVIATRGLPSRGTFWTRTYRDGVLE